VFLINRGELLGRFDPYFYDLEFINLKKKVYAGKYKVFQLGELLTELYRYPTFYDIDYKKYGVCVLKIGNITKEGFLDNDLKNYDFIDEDISKNFSRTIVLENDLVMAVRGATIGKTAIVTKVFENSNINANLIKISVNKNVIRPYYLWIYLNSYVGNKIFLQNVAHTAKQTITAPQIKSLIVPLPSIKEQDEIIALFETAYNAKKQKEAEAAALLASIDGYLLQELGITLPPASEKKTFFIARSSQLSGGRFDPFYHLVEFDYLEKSLNESQAVKFSNLIKIITKGETPLWKGEDYVDNGIPFLKVQNISIDGIIGNLTYIEEELHNKMVRSKLKGGELLYTMAGSIGVATILPIDFGEANINQAIAKIILRNDIAINESYLIATLNSSICKKQAQRFLTVSAQPNINFEQIKQIKIPLPSIKKQTEIANHISAIRFSAKQLQQQAAAELEQAKQQVEKLILGE
jgi:type I restriction enzyme S subunit